jgi:hypothetical protein
MKTHTYTIIALIVLTGSMAVAAQAQTSRGTELRASIPFQFNVGDKTMPAGEYTISQVNPSSDPAVMQLHAKDGSRAVMIQVNNVIGNGRESSRLLFNRYGSQYFFAQAWTMGDITGWQAPKSKAERLASKELADMKPAPATIALRLR